jgi:hypothetical protein
VSSTLFCLGTETTSTKKSNLKLFNDPSKSLIQGGIMSDFSVTDLAVEKLKEYMEQNNIDSALRVALMQGG